MAKIRAVKPEFWTDIDMLELPINTRLFYIGLWNFVDDNGVFEWNPRQLKVLIFPCDNIDVSKCLTYLTKKQIVKFEHEGKYYGIILSFGKHQKIDNRYRREILDTTVLPHRDHTVTTESPATDGDGDGDGDGDVRVTPSQIAQEFFDKGETFQKVQCWFLEKGIPETELEKFCDYWTEPNKGGTKVRWQLQKTFDVRRRLKTWLDRSPKFSPQLPKRGGLNIS